MVASPLLFWLLALVGGWVLVRLGGKLARWRGVPVDGQIAAGFGFAVAVRLVLLLSATELEADGAPYEVDWLSAIGSSVVGAGLWSAMDWLGRAQRPDPYASPGRPVTGLLVAAVVLPALLIAGGFVALEVMRPRAVAAVLGHLDQVREHVEAHEQPRRCADAIERFEVLAREDRISMRAAGQGRWVNEVVRDFARGEQGWHLWCSYVIGVAESGGQPPDLMDEFEALGD